jgi:hypothetical protein
MSCDSIGQAREAFTGLNAVLLYPVEGVQKKVFNLRSFNNFNFIAMFDDIRMFLCKK